MGSPELAADRLNPPPATLRSSLPMLGPAGAWGEKAGMCPAFPFGNGGHPSVRPLETFSCLWSQAHYSVARETVLAN